MVKFGLVSTLIWAASLALASPSRPAPLVGVRTRNFPGKSDEYTLHAVWRRLAALSHRKRQTVFKNSTSIDKSWNDATLFSYTHNVNTSGVDNLEAQLSIDVSCHNCYIKAGATAQLTINGTFDFGGVISNITGQLGDELKNLTKTIVDGLEDVVESFFDEATTAILSGEDFNIDDVINFNDFHVDTDIDILPPPLPEVQLLFQIDYLDLYMVLDTTLAAGATLTLPLYKSQSAVGISAGEGLEIGLFVTMDLILSVEGEISLRSGFHLLLDRPMGFNIDLFGDDVSRIIFNGGKFEFLPVTILSGNVALKAILRLGMHAGFEITSEGLIPKFIPVKDEVREKAQFKAGVEVGVFATVAEFLTNITGGALLAAEDGCALKIVEEYTLALGAVAGATLAIMDHTWGPQPNTTIPVFYTTLADVCAATAKATPTATSSQAVSARQAADSKLVTTTLSTKLFLTNVACADPTVISCPAAQQTTTIQTTTKTLITAVPSGVTPTFPEFTALTVASTIPFGKQVNKLSATSGVPVSFVPPPPPPSTTTSSASPSKTGDGNILTDIGNVVDGETGGVSNKLIIGLSVGLGVPILAAVIGGLVQWLKRRRYRPVPRSDTSVEYTGGYDSPMSAEREGMLKKTPVVSVGEPHTP